MPGKKQPRRKPRASETLPVRVTLEELLAIKAKAQAKNQTASDWIRDKIKILARAEGRPRIYKPCAKPVGKDGYRRHQFDKKTGLCWGCGLTREQVRI